MNAIEERAVQFLQDLGLYIPKLDLKLLCKKLDIQVFSEPLKGCEGVLLVTPETQRILINSENKDRLRNRFTISHEVGHYNLHIPLLGYRTFSCSKEQVALEGNVSTQEEVEANKFASSLLMPAEFFNQSTKNKNINWELIGQLAESFDTSLVATATRFVQLTSHSMWLVVVKNGIIQRYIKSSIAEHPPQIKQKFTTRKLHLWVEISAEEIFYENRWTRNKLISISSTGENAYKENLILIWDKNHSLMNEPENDFDEDEYYERFSRDFSYRDD